MNWNPPRWVSIYLMIFENQKFSKIFGSLRKSFFALQYIKNWTKVVTWKKKMFLKKIFVSLKKNYFWNFMKWGLKGGISIDADSDPPRYVLWCCGGICHQLLTFFQIGCGHTVWGKLAIQNFLRISTSFTSKSDRNHPIFCLPTLLF